MAQLFYELNLPEQNFNDDGDVIWLVRIKDTPPFYLTNNGNYELNHLWLCNSSIFHFPTEHEAHRQACEYHSKHGKHYPYFLEYSKSSLYTSTPTPTAKTIVNDIQSQQMIFK